MTEITMPKLSDTMTEGRFGIWRKNVGERVHRGEILAEVETDKAVMELEAFTDGVLLETRVAPGESVSVGAVIGIIGEAGEVVAVPDAGPLPSPEPPVAATDPAEQATRFLHSEHHEGRAAPAVRRRAHELGIDLSHVPGSGPDGRVLPADLERYMGVALGSGPEPAVVMLPAAGVEPADVAESPTEQSGSLSRMRAAIARTVTESWRAIPHFSVELEAEMTAAAEIRRELRQGDDHLSINDLVVKAAALALRNFPQVNSSFLGDRLISHDSINIGIAVALADGLLVPVVRNCDRLPLREVAAHCRRLAVAARSGDLAESDLTGGTFTVSNLGGYGVSRFTAIILPPQAAILAVGAVRDAPVARNGSVAVVPVMTLTLCADHRVLDGAVAARFLTELRQFLENPVLMLT